MEIAIILLCVAVIIIIQVCWNLYRNDTLFDLEIRINDLEIDNNKLKLRCKGLTNKAYCHGCTIDCTHRIMKEKSVKNGKVTRKNNK